MENTAKEHNRYSWWFIALGVIFFLVGAYLMATRNFFFAAPLFVLGAGPFIVGIIQIIKRPSE
jgi:uncharacterized membrane protein HdeD (DUF308 family)